MTDQALATTVPLRPAPTEQQAREIYRQGEEAVVFALLSLARMRADASIPAVTTTTPSAMIPPFLEPKAAGRRERPGRENGHPGSRRPTPEVIDNHVDHRLETRPDCHGTLTRTNQTRTRITEDIPEAIKPGVTEHTTHRDWCPRSQKAGEPVVTDALPGATIGNRTLVLSAWLHYGLGNTPSQIVAVFNHHLTMKLAPGGLIPMWYRLQAILFAWYLEIQAQALDPAVLHADETGWRVNGKTHRLWCFTTTELTYSLIDRSRGSPALAQSFKEEFDGTLVTDFWGAYNKVACARRQTCLVHLLKDINAKVLEAVRRLRRQMARRGNRGRKRKRGRPAMSRAKREGLTNKEKAHYVFKRRHLIVKRPDHLTDQERDELATMFVYLPELATLRSFVDRVSGLFEDGQSAHWAWCRRAALLRSAEFAAVPELAEAMGMLAAEKFAKMIAFLASPAGQRVRTYNHVERTNRRLRFLEKLRYKWRRRRTLVRFVVLVLDRWRRHDQGSKETIVPDERSPKPPNGRKVV